jgi:hypothetical protein
MRKKPPSFTPIALITGWRFEKLAISNLQGGGLTKAPRNTIQARTFTTRAPGAFLKVTYGNQS